MELRMRVRKSATGSVRFIHSPSSPVRSNVCLTPKNLRGCLFRVVRPDFCTKSSRPDEVSGVGARLRAAHGFFILPARLDDARNFSLEGERTEAETAYAELAKERARTTAELAAVVLARLELRFPCVFDAFCGSCHVFCSLSLMRITKRFGCLSLCSDA